MAYSAGYLTTVDDVITYTSGTYSDALRALSNVWGKTSAQTETLLNARYGAADFASASAALSDAGVVVAKNPSGYNCYAFESAVTNTFNTASSAVNSNASVTTVTKAAPVIDTTIDSTTNTVKAVPATKAVTVGGVTHNLKMFAGSAIQAVSAAGLGISLGKTIDSTLYNLNPNFWDSVGMSTLNPETWATITNGDDSFAANLFNTVFGIDTDTGYGQMYLDENAAAYLAYWMAQQGIFAPSETYYTIDSDIAEQIPAIVNGNITLPVYAKQVSTGYVLDSTNTYNVSTFTFTSAPDPIYIAYLGTVGSTYLIPRFFSRSPFSGSYHYYYGDRSFSSSYNSITIGDTKYEFYDYQAGGSSNTWIPEIPVNYQSGSGSFVGQYGYIILFGNEVSGGGIEGIGNQDGATLPNVSSWDSVPNTLTSLKSQYPDLWGNSFTNNVVQPDGSVLTKTYIPVATPNTTGMQDTQPTSTEQTQQNPQVVPNPTPNADNANLLQTIIKYLTQPQPETQTQTEPDTDIPQYPDTGTGETELAPLPAGTASALWSVYHPTQAQVNSFGAWLWSDDFIENIKKIMNDPMAGIITLHKIFATPVDSGSGTIVVGKLDSGVASATVNQQYVTVDCGSVTLSEEFGNVFDYNPFTDVSLYLPFIGIVPLDTADVMRSTIHVVYGVDVYTGACLAQVEVSRDGNTVNMYQYAGVCSVEYPLTGAQHNGLITGLLGIGTSVAGLVTGNLPMAAGAMAGAIASAAKRTQSRANSFSGNAGAMGIKVPYLIISRPQTKVANTFPQLQGYPTNYSVRLGDCSGQVQVRAVHVENVHATEQELREIENLLASGVLV